MRRIGLVRRARALVVVGALAVGLVLATAGTAQAGVIVVSDGFEGNPASVWNVEHYGNSNGGFDINAGLARSGRNNAWLTAQTDFSAVGRTFTFSTSAATTCGGAIYVRSLGGVSVIHVAVFDPQTTIGTRFEYTLSGTSWQQVNFPQWQWRSQPVALRVALIGNGRSQGLLLDDISAQCVTRYP